MGEFDYITRKIREAEFAEVPYRHIYLDGLLSEQHFTEITSSPEINIPPQRSDGTLFDTLLNSGYSIVEFPGCITDKNAYLAWHGGREKTARVHSATEGFGVTLRLTEPRTPLLADLRSFLEGPEFNAAIAEKFGIDFAGTFADGGIQKYLDGYEIAPHPDIRYKALTFMVNINPHQHSESANHHTHYMRFRPEFGFVQRFWEGNPDCERCWVPWQWCDTVSTQPRNNSIVIFAPSNDTLHAVAAKYDHLAGQRTQLYGNLWHNERRNPDRKRLIPVEWESFDIRRRCASAAPVKKNASILHRAAGKFGRIVRGNDNSRVIEERLRKS